MSTALHVPESAPTWRHWALCLAGPAALGAASAAKDSGAITEVLRLPLVWVGVAALMVPALYIGVALSGRSPSGRQVLGSLADAVCRGGGLLLGLAPALLFLVVTSDRGPVVQGLVAGVAGIGALAGLSVLFRKLCTERDAGVLARFVFISWAAVLLGIGAQLFTLGRG